MKHITSNKYEFNNLQLMKFSLNRYNYLGHKKYKILKDLGMYIMIGDYEWSGWLVELNICIVQEQSAL